jgi:hypothetical protein
MMRKAFTIAIAALICVSFVGLAMASEKGNKRKGKYTYRKVYKACFERGEVQEPKPIVNPDAHTQAEWTTIFEEQQFEEFKCKQEWETLDDTALLDIYTYLHAHAFDSPTPAKCK